MNDTTKTPTQAPIHIAKQRYAGYAQSIGALPADAGHNQRLHALSAADGFSTLQAFTAAVEKPFNRYSSQANSVVMLCQQINAGYLAGKSGLDDDMVDKLMELSNLADFIQKAVLSSFVSENAVYCGECGSLGTMRREDECDFNMVCTRCGSNRSRRALEASALMTFDTWTVAVRRQAVLSDVGYSVTYAEFAKGGDRISGWYWVAPTDSSTNFRKSEALAWVDAWDDARQQVQAISKMTDEQWENATDTDQLAYVADLLGQG